MNAMPRIVAAALVALALAPGLAARAGDQVPQADRPRQYRPLSISFPDSRGKQFFNARVLPALAANGCLTCHTPASGDVHPAIQYEHLLPYLAMGQGATNNILMLKLANQRSFNAQQPAHVGGQRCSSEDEEPCKSIQAWWRIEFGDVR
jgi:hypothetical protein